MIDRDLVTIEIPRNGHYQHDWQICDRSEDGKSWVPRDLTGHTLAMRFRHVAGQGSVLASASLDVYDPANGWVTVTIAGNSFGQVQGTGEIVTLSYDLKDTHPDGISPIPLRGHALLIPGVS